MALIELRREEHFNSAQLIEPGVILQEPISGPNDIFTDREGLNIVPQGQLDYWLLTRTEEDDTATNPSEEDSSPTPTVSRRSSLKDTSEIKFPKTPKTKTVRWPEDDFLATYRSIEEEIELRTEQLLESLLVDKSVVQTSCRREASEFSENQSQEAQDSLQLEVFTQFGTKVDASVFVIKGNVPRRSRIPPPKPCRQFPHQTHAYNSVTDNPYAYHGADTEACNTSDTHDTKKRSFPFRAVKAIWTKLRGTLIANNPWRQTETNLHEEDGRCLMEDISQDSLSLDIPLSETHLYRPEVDKNTISEINLPRWLSWAQVGELSPSILNFQCKSHFCPCRSQPTKLTWLLRLWTWRPSLFSPFTSNKRPGAHARSIHELLQVRDTFKGIREREIHKDIRMAFKARGKAALNLLGAGNGLGVVFEDGDTESGLQCWRCDTCEFCLGMVLKELHPFESVRGRKFHTCCLRGDC